MLPKSAYTSWGLRVVAALIDAVPSLIVLGIGYGIFFGTAENVCVTDTSPYQIGTYCTSDPTSFGIAAVVLAFLLSIAYWVWNLGYRQGTTGSSIGKAVMKFKVVSERTWAPVGFGLSVVRQLAHIVDGFCYIGYLWPLWDAKRQTFADKIMTTVCVPLS